MSDKEQPELPDPNLVASVGAIVFASGDPVDPREVVDALEGVDPESVERLFDALEQEYDRCGVGIRLEKVAGGYRLATQPAVGALVRNFFRHRHRTRLSPAALETLAIVAYRQPVTSPEIQAIRGKDSSASLKNLLDKKLLRILGRKKVVGNPILYGTSKQFLVHFGLDSLEDLPSIEDFDEFVGALAEKMGSLPEDPDAVTEGLDETAAISEAPAEGVEESELLPEEATGEEPTPAAP